MRYKHGYHSGFTLIELLVVISIIGVLSSVVMASVNTARMKARDAAVKQLALQMRNVYEIEYLNKGKYSDLMKAPLNYLACSNTPGVTYTCLLISQNACNTFYGADSEGAKVCLDVLNKGVNFHIGTVDPNNFVDKYAVFLQYPGNSSLGRCVGSSGNVIDSSQSTCFTSGGGW
jgi:prepilin-type N-terminal cleavage/methylation domain-containing protein